MYCELEDMENVERFEDILKKLGRGKGHRPHVYSMKPPLWFSEGRERKEGEDPLAVIILAHGRDCAFVTSGYRSKGGREIDKDTMYDFLSFLVGYERDISRCGNCKWFKAQRHVLPNGAEADGLCTYYGSDYSKFAKTNICFDYVRRLED